MRQTLFSFPYLIVICNEVKGSHSIIMADQTTHIPWQNQKQWQALTPFFDTIRNLHHKDLNPVYQQADTIRQLFISLSRPMDELCAVTCIHCQDICCKKATIWFDFKDLLYLYFAFGRLPDTQISKNKDRVGHCQCCHFSNTGCLLSRLERPFVCTWYLCPDQKQALMSGDDVKSEVFMATINRIKGLRTEMESQFCRLSAGMQDVER